MDDDSWFEPDEKPRFLVAKGAVTKAVYAEGAKPSKTEKLLCLAFAMAFLAASILTSGMFLGIPQILLFWLACSLALGPFAPLQYTAGDCRVGLGDPLPEPLEEEEPEEETKKGKSKGAMKRSSSAAEVVDAEVVGGMRGDPVSANGKATGGGARASGGAGEWSTEEMESLRKLMLKHPKGTARRWELIAVALGTSRSTEDIIRMSKQMAEKKPTDADAYSTFLSQRKNSERQVASDPSQRVDEDQWGASEAVTSSTNQEGGAWTPALDQALVKAMKEVGKDVSGRWEKIAAAVDGKTKSECFKRYGELKDAFRAAKAKGEEVQEVPE